MVGSAKAFGIERLRIDATGGQARRRIGVPQTDTPMNGKRSVALLVILLLAGCNVTRPAPPLPRLAVDPDGISVSGLSSGGFMAVQVHVAHSAVFRRGAGIVAGGPFYCSEGFLGHALGRCMAHSGDIPVRTLAAVTRDWADRDRIDPVGNLGTSRIYLFSGTTDRTVAPAVVNDLEAYYRSLAPASNIVHENGIAAGHAMITDDYGGRCETTAPPFINDCDFDLAGEMLRHLYGPLKARNDGALRGRLTEFDQAAFVSGHGMAERGWVYIPQTCTAGATCALHVVFHGCRQNTATLGETFIRHAGYNRWADTNDIVVLYPQTDNTAPNGCWDWWGYDDADFACKSAPQIRAVKAMVDRLSGGGNRSEHAAASP